MGISAPEHERSYELIESLKKRVDVVLDMHREIFELPDDATDEEVETWLHTTEQRIVDQFDPALVAKAKSAYEGEITLVNEHGATPPFEALQRFSQDFPPMDPEGEFVKNVISTFRTLRYKHARVKTITQSQSGKMHELRVLLHDALVSTDVVEETQVHPFEITYVVQDDYFKNRAQLKNLAGLHFTGTPLSLVRSFGDQDFGQNTAFRKRVVESTARHESMHNVLDGAGGIGSHESEEQLFISSIGRDRGKHSTLDVASIEQIDPDVLLDNLHNELIANLEGIEVLPMTFLKQDEEQRFQSYLSSVLGSTRPVVETYYQALQINRPEEALAFRKKVVDSIDHLTRAYHMAWEIDYQKSPFSWGRNFDTVNAMHALAMVLPPSKYRHMPRYLEHAYPEEIAEVHRRYQHAMGRQRGEGAAVDVKE